MLGRLVDRCPARYRLFAKQVDTESFICQTSEGPVFWLVYCLHSKYDVGSIFLDCSSKRQKKNSDSICVFLRDLPYFGLSWERNNWYWDFLDCLGDQDAALRDRIEPNFEEKFERFTTLCQLPESE